MDIFIECVVRWRNVWNNSIESYKELKKNECNGGFLHHLV